MPPALHILPSAHSAVRSDRPPYTVHCLQHNYPKSLFFIKPRADGVGSWAEGKFSSNFTLTGRTGTGGRRSIPRPLAFSGLADFRLLNHHFSSPVICCNPIGSCRAVEATIQTRRTQSTTTLQIGTIHDGVLQGCLSSLWAVILQSKPGRKGRGGAGLSKFASMCASRSGVVPEWGGEG